ncbi:hypothetical protein M426DRAFT_73157 [Hypoxylon sp. CI-4A]|nr:hypothetical protein M426DRAFT_73157 [Hypoxylon sp. CI-4A]
MSRRFHRKSRAGCSECKRRHIKCDESRPACGNCSIRSRQCSFLASQPNLPNVGGRHAEASLSPGHQSNASTPSQPASTSPGYELPNSPDVNMTHMELLNHSIHTDFDLPPSSGDPENAFEPTMIMEAALSCPFLMNEVLAFSALHMSHLKPEKAEFYKHHAVHLQTSALGIFNREKPKVTRESCIPLMFFTWFMTLHTLRETTESTDVHSFLDRFVHYMQLHRGVRAVTAEAWQMLTESKMGSVLQAASSIIKPDDPGSNTDDLRRRVEESETLDDNEKFICKDALGKIQWFLNRVDRTEMDDPSLIITFLSVTSWPVMIDADFLRLVSDRKPEALLTLSYYAIPLHLCRDIWVIGRAGQLLLQSIRLQLDEKWHEWLDWPERMVNKPS